VPTILANPDLGDLSGDNPRADEIESISAHKRTVRLHCAQVNTGHTLNAMQNASESTARLTLDDLRREGVTISVERAGTYCGVSRSLAYQMARDGSLPTIKLGARRVRVPTAALLRLLGVEN
jgi:excisionase family DNA binding protein